MPDLISLTRTAIRGHPFEFIVDYAPEQESGTGWSLPANVCGGFMPNLIRGSEFYQPVAGTTLTYIIAGVITSNIIQTEILSIYQHQAYPLLYE